MDMRNLLLAAAAFAAAVPAQQEPAVREKPPASAPAAKKSVEQWIEALGSDSYRTRIEAERNLRELGQSAVPALEKAAQKSEDAEVQWRARRVLRQIEHGDVGPVETKKRNDGGTEVAPTPTEPGQRPRQRNTDPMRDQFESLFERLNRDFGVDIPRARFFDDSFFRDLQQQMQDGSSRSQGMTMQVGPDGSVHVEVKEKGEDGKEETKVYDAPDMDTFQKQYPGVLGKNGLGFRMFSFPGAGDPFGVGPLDPGGLRPWRVLPRTGPGRLSDVDVAPAEPTAPPAGRRLGISIKPEIPAEVREYLDLEAGVGLMVEGVQDGSLAAALGLQKGDIVTRVGSHPIRSTQDVQQALAPIKKGEAVEVQVVRKGATKTLTANKTEDAEAQAPDAGQKPADKPKLQRRPKQDESIR